MAKFSKISDNCYIKQRICPVCKLELSVVHNEFTVCNDCCGLYALRFFRNHINIYFTHKFLSHEFTYYGDNVLIWHYAGEDEVEENFTISVTELIQHLRFNTLIKMCETASPIIQDINF